MPYRVTPTDIADVLVLTPTVHADARGSFVESFNARDFRDATGVQLDFVQDNQSRSLENVVRGLHYQIRHPQGKLVRVTQGSIFDVVVDLRRSSPTFGRWVGHHLSADNHAQLWIPPGLAHGFVALSERADVLYKTTDYWHPEHERVLLWNDPALGIAWPLSGAPLLAAKDEAGTPFAQAEVFD